MSDIKIIQGEVFTDTRGQISSLNNFHFDGVRRTYIIHHPNVDVVRGWNAHQRERKWFYCTKGKFSVALVKIDNWEHPSENLVPEIFHLSEEDSKIVCVPAGYANCLKAMEPNSIMTVYSDKTMNEAAGDSWRFDTNLWVDWNQF